MHICRYEQDQVFGITTHYCCCGKSYRTIGDLELSDENEEVLLLKAIEVEKEIRLFDLEKAKRSLEEIGKYLN